jgi:hypothetical protein
MAATDIKERRVEIELLIADDNIAEAVKRLMDYVRDFSADNEDLNEVIVISANFKRLEKAERRGMIDFDEVGSRRDKLLYQVFGLMDTVTGALGGVAA